MKKYFYCIIFLFQAIYCFNIANNKKLYMLYPRDQVMERLLESLPRKNDERQIRSDKISAYTMRKRNNAELVNHILKNLDEVDLLGDVGR